MRGGKNKQRILKKLDVFIACEKKRLSKKKKLRSASSIFYTKQNTSLSVCSTRKELVVRFSSELHNKNFNFGCYRRENALKEKRKVQKLVVLDCLI